MIDTLCVLICDALHGIICDTLRGGAIRLSVQNDIAGFCEWEGFGS